jgi:hypothetical protein
MRWWLAERMTVRPSARLTVLVTSLWLAPPLSAQIADSVALPPAGFGTLKTDDASIRLALENLQLRVVPLDERIIRLLSPDTYLSFNQLRTSHAAEIDTLAFRASVRRPALFLVTFFGLQPQARFTPDDVTISSQNRFFRPVAILPLSLQWSELRLRQRETVNAIYLYEDGIALLEPMVVSYGGISSSQWERSLRTLEQERARVYARAAAVPGRK